MDYSKKGFGTRAIHSAKIKENVYGSLTTPIHQTSTFIFENCEQGGNRFAGEEEGYIYTRLGNPTVTALEKRIASLDNAQDCIATSSGMGAISSVFWTIASAGKHIIADEVLYGCTYALLSHGLTRYGVEVTLLDTSNIEEVKKALRPNTCAVYLETPANPTLKICDIKAIADVAHGYNKDIKVICDNTFASPYITRPIDLGADIVVYSATKYLNGHSDVIAGFVCGTKEFISEVRLFGIKDMTGAVLSPHDAYLIIRGLKTFEIRMIRHCENARLVADFLKNHPKIDKVYFPGLETHENHEIAKKQMDDFGGMVSFEVKGGKENGIKLLNSLNLCTLAVSLGGCETLIEHPASMTHSAYTKEELKEAGIPEGLVRLALGLENAKDIIEDLKSSLDNL